MPNIAGMARRCSRSPSVPFSQFTPRDTGTLLAKRGEMTTPMRIAAPSASETSVAIRQCHALAKPSRTLPPSTHRSRCDRSCKATVLRETNPGRAPNAATPTRGPHASAVGAAHEAEKKCGPEMHGWLARGHDHWLIEKVILPVRGPLHAYFPQAIAQVFASRFWMPCASRASGSLRSCRASEGR